MHEEHDTGESMTQQALASFPRDVLVGPEDVSTRRPRDATELRAVGLGWMSVGLGLAQVLAPRPFARLIGASDGVVSRGTVRAIGVREMFGGLGILLQPRPNVFMWARLAGDLVDLALLSEQIVTNKKGKGRLALAAVAVAGVAALDAKTALDLQRARRGQNIELPGIEVKHAVTINAPAEQVYAFWRNLENLPKFMAHLESVTVRDGKSVWRASAPAGTSVEWEANITKDEPNKLIEWSSLPDSTISNRGSVRFSQAPGGRGTEVRVELVYEPPAGALGAAIAKLFGEEPKQQIKSDMRRLKQVIETGEVLHSDASIHEGLHPAQPASSNRRLSSAAPKKPAARPARGTHIATAATTADVNTVAAAKTNDSEQPSEETSTTNQGFGTTRDDDAG